MPARYAPAREAARLLPGRRKHWGARHAGDRQPRSRIARRALADVGSVRREITSTNSDLAARLKSLERNYNALQLRIGRPNGGAGAGDDERAQAIGLLEQKHALRAPKVDVSAPETSFSEEQITEAEHSPSRPAHPDALHQHRRVAARSAQGALRVQSRRRPASSWRRKCRTRSCRASKSSPTSPA